MALFLFVHWLTSSLSGIKINHLAESFVFSGEHMDGNMLGKSYMNCDYTCRPLENWMDKAANNWAEQMFHLKNVFIIASSSSD